MPICAEYLCLRASCSNRGVGAAEGFGLVAGQVLHADHHQLRHCLWSQQGLQIWKEGRVADVTLLVVREERNDMARV